ncbi:MAG: dihydropteroate synthase [Sphingobacteriaceae bacterium]
MADKNTEIYEKTTLKVGGKLLNLSTPRVMGILNLTPDSFYQPEGRQGQPAIDQILKEAEQMLTDGAELLDLGAYSSRPNAEHISAEEERNRLIPAVKALVYEFPQALLSIDTFRANVAEEAIAVGAHLINDISGGELDTNMFETVARLKVPYILMHMKGTPQNMQQNPHYEDLITEMLSYFREKIRKLVSMGVHDLIIDPGFGFAKTLDHNYEILNRLEEFKMLGFPLLAGVSRKSMIYKLLGGTAADALNGTSVANTVALLKGAKILRVHDVKPAVEAVKIIQAMGRIEH